MDPAINTSLQTVNGWVILPSLLKRSDLTPRFNLSFPAYFLSDAGAVHLIANETNDGYEPPTRNLIERTLRRGDLFVDIGAHWGFFTLQAATHPAGEIEVVAFEPELINATILSENVARNNAANVAIVCAACGDEHQIAPLVTNSTMRHVIYGADKQFDGRTPSKWVPVVTIDAALAKLQKAAGRRLILKIDAEGYEPNIIAGARSVLASGRVALVIWECGDAFQSGPRHAAMTQMVAALSDCGFRHFRPPGAGGGDSTVEFSPQSGWHGNVFSFAPQLLEDAPVAAVAGVR